MVVEVLRQGLKSQTIYYPLELLFLMTIIGLPNEY